MSILEKQLSNGEIRLKMGSVAIKYLQWLL